MRSADSTELLRGLSSLLGVIYTLAWSLSFYPQILLNIRRRSTHGTTPAFAILNVLGFLCYTISTLAFFSLPLIQQQYRGRHGGTENTVRGNDVAFAVHAMVLSTIALTQFWSRLWGFESLVFKAGKGIWVIVVGSIFGVFWIICMALSSGDESWQWLDVIYAFGYVKLFVTVVKYSPQVYTNYIRQSTAGWAIYQILLDLLGGVLSLAQLLVDSGLQKDWSGISGNPVKFGLSNVSIFFDLVFMVQHYILYRKSSITEGSDREREGLLAKNDEEANAR